MTIRWRSGAQAALAALVLAGCRSTPEGSVTGATEERRFEAREVVGEEFVHTVFAAPGPGVDHSRPLFVFLEGDGRPWGRGGTRPAADPGPRRTLALELAELVGPGAVLLGRPCYHDHARDPGCAPELWTAGRYSERVVSSMVAALRRTIGDGPSGPVVLVGYSGGGALALLIADRMPEVAAVVTLGANLDLEAWTRYHHYLPLADSLDPLVTRGLPPGCEIHIAAGNDTVVPLALSQSAADRRPGALLWIEPGADHDCCWQARWADIFARVNAQLRAADCLGRYPRQGYPSSSTSATSGAYRARTR